MLYPNGTRTSPKISSGYGPRSGGAFSFHYGTDFVGFSNIQAVAGGRVTSAGWLNNLMGNAVAIDISSSNGVTVTHVYGHLASVSVRAGQQVSEGTKVGVMGATGNPSGKCLHFEVRTWRGSQMTTQDPVPYLAYNVNPPKPADVPPPSSGGTPATNVMLTWGWLGIQAMLKHDFGYQGALDNRAGSATVSAFQRFIKAKGYRNLVIDGKWGVETVKGAQSWLKAKWGYTGAIDGVPGPGTKAAWDKANASNLAAYRKYYGI